MPSNRNTLALLLAVILVHSACAYKTPDVVKKVLKATREFTTYEIRYQKLFKYQGDKDTIRETYHSRVNNGNEKYYIGYHYIYSTPGMMRKSAVAVNTTEIARVNYSDSMYFALQLSDDEKKVTGSLQGHIYHPLLMTKEDYDGYEISGEAGNLIMLQKTDTVRDQKQRVKVVNRTVISINKDSWLPESEESWALFRTGGTQYSNYKLLSCAILGDKAYKPILKSADSLIKIIKTYADGDSIKNSRKQQYLTTRIGDSARIFKAILHGSNTAYNVSSFKDSIVIVDFFYTTCAPCIAAIPEINNVYLHNRHRGVRVFGIDAFETDWGNLDQFVRDRSVAYPILKTDKSPVYAYGVTGYPRLFVIKNGIIVKIYYGFTRGLEQELQKLIDELSK